MKRFPMLAALAMALLLLPWHASAQMRTPQQEEVWVVVQAEWHAGFDMDSMQRFRRSEQRFGTPSEPVPWAGRARHEKESISTGVHGQHPIEVVLPGETAVIHEHYYSPNRMDREGKFRILRGRSTDILVHEKDQWFRDGNGEAPEAALSGQERTWERTH